MSEELAPLWTDERIGEAAYAEFHLYADHTCPDGVVVQLRCTPTIYCADLMRQVRDEYEAERQCLFADHAALVARIAELEAQVKQQDSDWLKMLRAIARLDPTSEWEQADDGAVWEQFDPWQALAELEAQLAAARRWEPLPQEVLEIIQVWRNAYALRSVGMRSTQPLNAEQYWEQVQLVDKWLDVCRLTDAPGDIPADVRATMREALEVHRGMFFANPAIDAALAWLDAKPLDAKPLDMPDGPGWWAFDGSEWESKPIYLLDGVEYDEWQEEWTEKAEHYWRHRGTEWPKAVRHIDIPGPPFRTIVEISWVHAGQAVCRPKQSAPHHGEPVLGFLSPKYRWNHAYYTPDNWVGKWYRLYMPWEQRP